MEEGIERAPASDIHVRVYVYVHVQYEIVHFVCSLSQSASVLAGTGKGRTAEEKKRDEE